MKTGTGLAGLVALAVMAGAGEHPTGKPLGFTDIGVYGTLFYTMTGFHGAHVLGGVIGLAVILSRGIAGQFTKQHHVAVEAVHYYWHFVDVVWILLFLTIYVVK